MGSVDMALLWRVFLFTNILIPPSICATYKVRTADGKEHIVKSREGSEKFPDLELGNSHMVPKASDYGLGSDYGYDGGIKLTSALSSPIHLECPLFIACRSNLAIGDCSIKTPYNEEYKVKTGEKYEGGRLDCLCRVVRDKEQQKKNCGILIRFLEEKDIGEWRCSVEGGGKKASKVVKVKTTNDKKGCEKVEFEHDGGNITEVNVKHLIKVRNITNYNNITKIQNIKATPEPTPEPTTEEPATEETKHKDSVDLLTIDEITNINNITNLDKIKKIIEGLKPGNKPHKDSIDLLNIDEILNINNITNIDEIVKILAELVCGDIEDADEKKKCLESLVNGGTDEENQCSHIEDPEEKKKCEEDLENGGTDEENQCSFIEDPETKAKCEAGLDGDGTSDKGDSDDGDKGKGEAEDTEELNQCSFIEEKDAKAKCESGLA